MSDTRFTAATKLDANKPPIELLPWEAVEGVARVLDMGRVKYSPWNWRKGFEWGRLIGAALRHIFAFAGGQDNDPESGLSHVDHAICCLMFLSAHIKSGLGKDDRAHTLEQPIPAAHVPKHKSIMWAVTRVFSEGLTEPVGPCFSNRDAAEAYMAKQPEVGCTYRLEVVEV